MHYCVDVSWGISLCTAAHYHRTELSILCAVARTCGYREYSYRALYIDSRGIETVFGKCVLCWKTAHFLLFFFLTIEVISCWELKILLNKLASLNINMLLGPCMFDASKICFNFKEFFRALSCKLFSILWKVEKLLYFWLVKGVTYRLQNQN